jgi:hypothetical protein
VVVDRPTAETRLSPLIPQSSLSERQRGFGETYRGRDKLNLQVSTTLHNPQHFLSPSAALSSLAVQQTRPDQLLETRIRSFPSNPLEVIIACPEERMPMTKETAQLISRV